jgi:hypothetical protein
MLCGKRLAKVGNVQEMFNIGTMFPCIWLNSQLGTEAWHKKTAG